jgi:inorganic pyrophosphatase
MNLWHDIEIGKKIPDEINVIIEIPRGSHNKYEIDKETGLIALDRTNYSGAPYPFDYGFVPKTLWDDGDALDVVLITTYPLETGVLVRVRPVGLMKMVDGEDSDDKIIGVPVGDKRFDEINNLSDLNSHSLKEYAHFFETYKVLKGTGNPVKVNGYLDKEAAKKAILRSVELYKEKFGK